jgi:ribosomal protein L6P/L9E
VVPIPNQIGVRVLKKDRKLIIYGASKVLVADFARKLYNYHRPSVYTGRGVRYKKGVVRRKLGKKDVRKGRRF